MTFDVLILTVPFLVTDFFIYNIRHQIQVPGATDGRVLLNELVLEKSK